LVGFFFFAHIPALAPADEPYQIVIRKSHFPVKKKEARAIL
jgi:hypothetical protein